MKLNIWKKWRKEPEEKKAQQTTINKNNQDKWLEKLEETLAKMRREVEESKKAKIKMEETRRKLLDQKKSTGPEEKKARRNVQTRTREERKKTEEETDGRQMGHGQMDKPIYR